MPPIRVLQVFTVMDRGGAESMIMNYYRHIDKTKVQFDFLVHRPEKGDFDDEITDLGGKIFRLNKINPFNPKPYYNELRVFFKTNHQYKIIHSHLNTFSCFPLKIAQEFNIPLRIAHAHIAIDNINLFSFFKKGESFKEIAKKAIKLQLKKRIHKYSNCYFTCGKKAGRWLFGERTEFTIMNNAIDAKGFAYQPNTALKYKKKYHLENDLVIGHIGRFNSQKNHAFLLEIFSALLKTHPNSSLVLVGDGPLRQNIQQLSETLGIAEKVHFFGVRKDIPNLCQMFDAFVFPSFYEGLPVTLIEAQAAGLKVFASNSITKEVLLTKDIRFLSLSESSEEWAKSIYKTDYTNRANHFETIKSNGYDIVKNANEIQKFYLKEENSLC